MAVERKLTIKEFAEEYKFSTKMASYMARSEVFRKYHISIDTALVELRRPNKHGTGRINHKWRIYPERYEAAEAKGLLGPR